MTVVPLRHEHLGPLKEFTDKNIGAGYYTSHELNDIFQRSQKDGVMCSFVLCGDQGEILGVRISFPPGHWLSGKGRGLAYKKWPQLRADTAYFQSLFISPELQGSDWGGQLSRASLKPLRQSGAKGVACHAWKESPGNSSLKYLTKLGFQVIAEHLNYWAAVNYNCTLCLKPPCQCTAVEMYLDLEKNHEHLGLA